MANASCKLPGAMRETESAKYFEETPQPDTIQVSPMSLLLPNWQSVLQLLPINNFSLNQFEEVTSGSSTAQKKIFEVESLLKPLISIANIATPHLQRVEDRIQRTEHIIEQISALHTRSIDLDPDKDMTDSAVAHSSKDVIPRKDFSTMENERNMQAKLVFHALSEKAVSSDVLQHLKSLLNSSLQMSQETLLQLYTMQAELLAILYDGYFSQWDCYTRILSELTSKAFLKQQLATRSPRIDSFNEVDGIFVEENFTNNISSIPNRSVSEFFPYSKVPILSQYSLCGGLSTPEIFEPTGSSPISTARGALSNTSLPSPSLRKNDEGFACSLAIKSVDFLEENASFITPVAFLDASNSFKASSLHCCTLDSVVCFDGRSNSILAFPYPKPQNDYSLYSDEHIFSVEGVAVDDDLKYLQAYKTTVPNSTDVTTSDSNLHRANTNEQKNTYKRRGWMFSDEITVTPSEEADRVVDDHYWGRYNVDTFARIALALYIFGASRLVLLFFMLIFEMHIMGVFDPVIAWYLNNRNARSLEQILNDLRNREAYRREVENVGNETEPVNNLPERSQRTEETIQRHADENEGQLERHPTSQPTVTSSVSLLIQAQRQPHHTTDDLSRFIYQLFVMFFMTLFPWWNPNVTFLQ